MTKTRSTLTQDSFLEVINPLPQLAANFLLALRDAHLFRHVTGLPAGQSFEPAFFSLTPDLQVMYSDLRGLPPLATLQVSGALMEGHISQLDYPATARLISFYGEDGELPIWLEVKDADGHHFVLTAELDYSQRGKKRLVETDVDFPLDTDGIMVPLRGTEEVLAAVSAN